MCVYETNETNEYASYQTRFIRFLLRENNKQTKNFQESALVHKCALYTSSLYL